MYSLGAIKNGIRSPEYTLKAIFYYILFYKDVKYIKTELSKYFASEDLRRHVHGASGGLKEILLYILVRKYKPHLMIETGVAQGISTYFILKAMKDNGFGKLISIDYSHLYMLPDLNVSKKLMDNYNTLRELGSGWIVPQELRDRWTFINGKTEDELPKLQVETIDMFFHDSDHSFENQTFEYEYAFSHMKKGILISDDVWWSDAYKTFIEKHKKNIKVLNVPISTMEIEA